ncbi:hypothetical protein BC629DRAFT_1465223 [Irpex lacteus]|nr:hypothetical protein BC629DRAFT_1465223 [Irpex lacteus]
MSLEPPSDVSQIPPPPAPTIEPNEVIPDTPADHDDANSTAAEPELNLEKRIFMVLYLTLFLIIFLGCIFTCIFSFVAVRATLAGALVGMTTLAILPGPFNDAISQIISSYSTPLVPLLWAFLRTALIGAATCGAFTGVVGGTISSIHWFAKSGLKRPPRGSRQALPAFTKQKPRKDKSEVKWRKRILHILERIVTPGIVVYVGILAQAYYRRAGDMVDEVNEYRLRTVAVTVAGNVVVRGLRYLRAWYNLSLKGDRKSGVAVGPQGVDEKLAISVNAEGAVPTIDAKERDSPV